MFSENTGPFFEDSEVCSVLKVTGALLFSPTG